MPQKRTPASFFSARITNSPSVPQPPATAAMTAARSGSTGVIQNSAAPATAAASSPSAQTRTEKLRSMCRATGRRRKRRLASSCAICAAAQTMTR